jgi:hypothetical protein
MSKWSKYSTPKEIDAEKRFHRQLQMMLYTWSFSKHASLIQAAKIVRKVHEEAGLEISFDKSIDLADYYTKGVLK